MNADKILKRKIIMLFGPMCSGKSSLIKKYCANNPETFHASMDNIKWFISDYSTTKYARLGTVNRILFAMNAQAVQENLSLIVEGSVGLMLCVDKYEKLAFRNKLELFKINVEAPYETLLERFYGRIRAHTKTNTPISINKDTDFFERFNAYHKHKDPNLPTLNSYVLDEEQMLGSLLEIIKTDP